MNGNANGTKSVESALERFRFDEERLMELMESVLWLFTGEARSISSMADEDRLCSSLCASTGLVPFSCGRGLCVAISTLSSTTPPCSSQLMLRELESVFFRDVHPFFSPLASLWITIFGSSLGNLVGVDSIELLVLESALTWLYSIYLDLRVLGSFPLAAIFYLAKVG